MCKFNLLGACCKGQSCLFAHSPDEMKPLPDLFRTKLCKTLINTGHCDEPDCAFAHNREELRVTPPDKSRRGDRCGIRKPQAQNRKVQARLRQLQSQAQGQPLGLPKVAVQPTIHPQAVLDAGHAGHAGHAGRSLVYGVSSDNSKTQPKTWLCPHSRAALSSLPGSRASESTEADGVSSSVTGLSFRGDEGQRESFAGSESDENQELHLGESEVLPDHIAQGPSDFTKKEEMFNAASMNTITDVSGYTGVLDYAGITIKNTFLNFDMEPLQPHVGLRMVRTAAGRLDLLAVSDE
eukprot:CAMPEP_0170599448 /NCGR_PEP_ID=MMETSP0224-20130122/16801_1 /TAXON_ID=285029 /ORGANISM="Togula jolla, Strain CCCM 725" /LENGTH=293 /DNA_ID=CAMNT_0010924097 /DNA_START=99 /DNA_END=980 /DNA_ORIENTATION=+